MMRREADGCLVENKSLVEPAQPQRSYSAWLATCA